MEQRLINKFRKKSKSQDSRLTASDKIQLGLLLFTAASTIIASYISVSTLNETRHQFKIAEDNRRLDDSLRKVQDARQDSINSLQIQALQLQASSTEKILMTQNLAYEEEKENSRPFFILELATFDETNSRAFFTIKNIGKRIATIRRVETFIWNKGLHNFFQGDTRGAFELAPQDRTTISAVVKKHIFNSSNTWYCLATKYTDPVSKSIKKFNFYFKIEHNNLLGDIYETLAKAEALTFEKRIIESKKDFKDNPASYLPLTNWK